jgi:hypothetical protein
MMAGCRVIVKRSATSRGGGGWRRRMEMEEDE